MLIKKHGYIILKNGKNIVYYKEFKLQTINRVLINSVTIDSASNGILDNLILKFKENEYLKN
ncbi:hypothetical protein FDF23_11455 [Fusobacterium nucleatum]|jgi:IS861, transposase orfA|nr:hypothetical protein [Fusobacterium nucleatum]